MDGPLIVLAALTLVLGWLEAPLTAFLAGAHPALHSESDVQAWLPYAALALALGGVGLAWVEFGRRRAAQKGFVEYIPALKALFVQRWYLDRLYRFLLDNVVYKGLARFCAENDQKVIDAGLDRLAEGTVTSGRLLHGLHAGMIQYKLLTIYVVLVLLAVYFIL